MSENDFPEGACCRRRLLTASVVVAGGAALAAAFPLVNSLSSTSLEAEDGGDLEVDLADLAPASLRTLPWRGRPLWILHRDAAMLRSLQDANARLADPESHHSRQPENCRNPTRSLRPEYWVAIGLCPHLGCVPRAKFTPGSAEGMPVDWPGGFICPCHAAFFDLAGRVYRGTPAPYNLEIPPYRFLSATRLLIGDGRPGRA